ncbi:DNA-methyltransferase [Xanthomonas oryzae pv. oryzicola]|uniref:DNA-methyltransferase n=2 Tax=Xanthomonas oryzae TaxID=347 RepID=UPI0005CF34AF|nr:site-specific DNA-methyltransferase [Xanthomonas oryzae]
MSRVIHVGDCLSILPSLAADSVDAIVTDPPYGLSFMGKRWDYDVPSTVIWAECLRVLKPGGHLLAFAGTRTQHRMAVRIEDAGFEIRDMIAWVYGSGFPKSHNGEWGGTALKPALEPITMARKPLIGTVAANHSAYGTGALNTDDCGIGARFSEGGRWPANVLHDGSDEVLAVFPDAKGQQGRALDDGDASGNAVYGALRNVTTNPAPRVESETSAARFFYCAKASKADRDEGLEAFTKTSGGMASNTSGQHITRRDADYAPAPRANNHPTVKPTDLMRYLCRLVTPAGGIVLDPFMGSGSTGKAAALEGFAFVGIEMDPAYAAIAEARIAAAMIAARSDELRPRQGDIFGEAA